MSKKEKEKNSIVNIIKENYGWVIAVITVIGIVILNIFRFLEYLNVLFYFNYYGIDINLYKYYDQNFLYSLCLSIIFIVAFLLAKINLKSQKKKKKTKNALEYCRFFW